MSASALDIQTLFAQHQGELLWHLRKIVKCEETAAELAQESYLILVESAGTQAIEQPRGFLFRVATNLAFSHLRRHKVAEANAPYLEVAEQCIPSAEHEASHQQRLEQLITVVKQLPPRRRNVFILYKIHGLSHREIADELGITVSGVEKHLAKALLFFRRHWPESAGG